MQKSSPLFWPTTGRGAVIGARRLVRRLKRAGIARYYRLRFDGLRSMGTQTTVMNIPRHPDVPAPSVDEILTAIVRSVLPTYDGGALLTTSFGVAYLPVPWDAQTWIGVGIGGLAGALGAGVGNELGKVVVEETGKAIGETVVKERVLPDRIRASLRRRGSFAAGFAEIVRVVHNATRWFGTDSIVVDISRSGEVNSYKVNFAQEVKNEHTAEAAAYIAIYRALTEGAWAWEDAMSSLEAAPAKPPRLLATDNPLMDMSTRAEASALKRDQVIRRALERHPTFKEFEHCPVTAETFGVFMRSSFIPG